MSIEVNGKKVKWIKEETIKDLLMRMRYTFPLVIVKIDKKVVPRSKYSDTLVPDHTKIDVIHMISGG